MTKILNKLIYILKNILLPLTFIATIYITVFMFKRLEKDIFGANLFEFLKVVIPFIILLILILVNSFLNIKAVKDNIFYNLTSFIVLITISIFCYRALLDQNMFLWHKYGYNINFNYFSDQIASIQVMLYGLSLANILLIIKDKLSVDKKVNKKVISET
ncbi:MAG: hypothetical protein ACI4WF_02680 [Bacilli bacterium]